MECVDTACSILGTKPQYINAEKKFIEEHKLTPWGDLPNWIGEFSIRVDNSLAEKEFDHKFIPFEESIKRIINYYASIGWPVPKAGLTPEREIELIQELESGK